MISDKHREVLQEAKQLERRRVEISEYAINNRIADLLPEPWAQLIEFDDIESEPVSISFDCGLNPKDAEVMTDRECRKMILWLGEMCQELRVHRKLEEDELE